VRSIQSTERPTRIEEALALAESLANPVRSTEDAAVQPADVKPEQERQVLPPKGIETQVHFFSDGRFAKLSEAALANLTSRLAGKELKALGNLNVKSHAAGKVPLSPEELAKLPREAQARRGPGNVNNLAIIGLNVLSQPLPAKKKINNPV